MPTRLLAVARPAVLVATLALGACGTNIEEPTASAPAVVPSATPSPSPSPTPRVHVVTGDPDADPAATIVAYAREHRDEFAGWYLDAQFQHHVAFTDHVADHTAALDALLVVPITVDEVMWSAEELGDLERRFDQPDVRRWLARHGLTVKGTSIDISANRVFLRLHTEPTDADVRRLVIDHLDGQDWLKVKVFPSSERKP